VRLPAFLEPALLARALARVDETRFREDPAPKHYGVRHPNDRRLTATDGSLDALLLLLLDDRRLFDFVAEVADCGPVASVSGAVFRMEPGRHFLDWHADYQRGGVGAALVINLSRRPFRGGRFQIKAAGARRLLGSLAYRRAGEALLIAVGRDLRHRSTPVLGRRAKTVFAGFFHRTSPRVLAARADDRALLVELGAARRA